MSTLARLRRRLLLVAWAVAVVSVIALVHTPPERADAAILDPDDTAQDAVEDETGAAEGAEGENAEREAAAESDTGPAPDELVDAMIQYVYDGDTVKASIIGGWTRNIRLLNINAPEIEHPDKPGECLGDEATDYLRELLPRGTRVQLAYDQFRVDDYQRDLAVIFKDGVNVNAEMVRAGLAEAIAIRENRTYYPVMQEAQRQARAAGVGLHGSACG